METHVVGYGKVETFQFAKQKSTSKELKLQIKQNKKMNNDETIHVSSMLFTKAILVYFSS